ncbi:MAG: hypothetical protein R3E68_12875 [Burkholderiaceae bacterium]
MSLAGLWAMLCLLGALRGILVARPEQAGHDAMATDQAQWIVATVCLLALGAQWGHMITDRPWVLVPAAVLGIWWFIGCGQVYRSLPLLSTRLARAPLEHGLMLAMMWPVWLGGRASVRPARL